MSELSIYFAKLLGRNAKEAAQVLDLLDDWFALIKSEGNINPRNLGGLIYDLAVWVEHSPQRAKSVKQIMGSVKFRRITRQTIREAKWFALGKLSTVLSSNFTISVIDECTVILLANR